MNYLFIAAGGGLGAVLRYVFTRFINTGLQNSFPQGIWRGLGTGSIGTLTVNCLGALLIGFLSGFLDAIASDPKWRLFFITGLLGGYTTFSTYSLETVQYFLSGNIRQGVANILLNNVLCLACVLLGMWIRRKVC
jgi:CrcB protein